ncbi:MAG: tetratricopeptide repeat protein [bacterium]|nr:tetratricopeptide repeat protein [bacterium]
MLLSTSRSTALAIVTLLTAVSCATPPGEAPHSLPEGHPPVDGKSPITFHDPQAEAYATFIRGVMLSGEGERVEALVYLQMSARLDSTAPAIHRELMKLYLETGNSAEAERSARRVLDLDPDQPEAHAVLGQILVETGRASEAIAHLERTVELAPDKTGTSFILADALERSGDIDGAVELLQKLASQEEHEAVANFHIARIRAGSGNIESAIPHLARAIELNPSFLKAVEEMGNQLEQDKGPGEAEKLYRSYLELDPEAIVVREYLARLLIRTERYSDARIELELVLGAQKENHGATLLMGMVEYQEGNNERALELFNQVRRMAPDSFEIVMQIGTLQRELKMYGEAVATFEDAATLAPSRYEPFLNLAVIHDAMDALPGAVSDLETALALEPDRTNLRTYLAQTLMRLDRHDEAVGILKEGLTRIPDEPSLLYQLAITYDRSGQFDRAVKTLEHLIKVKPDHFDAMNYLGYSWADRNMRLKEALNLVKRALEIKPDAPYIIDSLGWVYYRMGRYEEALELLIKAGEKMGGDVTVLEHIGDTYDKLGKDELAVEFWSLALAADPGNGRLGEKLKSKGAAETSP